MSVNYIPAAEICSGTNALYGDYKLQWRAVTWIELTVSGTESLIEWP